MSLLSLSCIPVLILFISILNHFLSSLIVPVAPGMITLAIPSVNEIISAAIVSEHMITIQFSYRFYLTAVTTWLSGIPFDLRSWLMSFTIVRLSSLNVVFVSGGKHTTRHVGSCTLFGLDILGLWVTSNLVVGVGVLDGELIA